MFSHFSSSVMIDAPRAVSIDFRMALHHLSAFGVTMGALRVVCIDFRVVVRHLGSYCFASSWRRCVTMGAPRAVLIDL